MNWDVRLKKILVISDSVHEILRYRSALVQLLKSNGHHVKLLSFIDVVRLKGLKYFFQRNIYISCHLRSNIIVLLFFPHKKGIIILNGLGRYKFNKEFRKFILWLIRINIRKTICVQNYHDYRYFRSYLASRRRPRLKWICGSGGEKKVKGSGNNYFSITRKSKFPLQQKNLEEFELLFNEKVLLIGIDQYEDHKCLGIVPNTDIFKYGKELVCLSGYGEGFPHILADAIVSDLNVWMEKRNYVCLGLSRLGIYPDTEKDKWVRISSYNKNFSSLSLSDINKYIYREIIKL